MKKIKVSEVCRMIEERRALNAIPFCEIEWVDDNGEPIEVDAQTRKMFEFSGLANIDFIGFWLQDLKKKISDADGWVR